MPIVRTVVRSLIAGVLAVAVAGVSGWPSPPRSRWPAPPIQDQHQQSAEAIGAVASGLAVSIDSVSPRFATTANSTITVRGHHH